ncbi:MAG TPA: type VII secretion protein EccB, partial [Phytomonospora sp.]
MARSTPAHASSSTMSCAAVNTPTLTRLPEVVAICRDPLRSQGTWTRGRRTGAEPPRARRGRPSTNASAHVKVTLAVSSRRSCPVEEWERPAMRTRREQVQAQRFVIRRIVSAMLSANPESLELPMRRMGLSILGGAMAAVLIAVGFFVVGFLFPGGATAWKQDGTIVIEQETGAAYVYNRDTLVPMLNFASARLFVPSDDPVVMTIRQKSLEGTPRANPMGIAGAPESLPDKKFLLTLPWQVCSAVSPAAENRLATRVVLGADTDPAADLAGQAVLLTTADRYYLLWNDRLYLVPEQDRTLPAIGMSTADAVEVTPLLLNAIESGPNLAIPIAGLGQPARELGGEPRKNGDVFKVETRFYVLDGAGLHIIGELAAKILGWVEGGPQLSAADVTANENTAPVEPERFPQAVPQLAPIDRDQSIAVCGAHSGGTTAN